VLIRYDIGYQSTNIIQTDGRTDVASRGIKLKWIGQQLQNEPIVMWQWY